MKSFAVVFVSALFVLSPFRSHAAPASSAEAPWAFDAAGELRIHAGRVTAEPLFIPVQVEGTPMEIIAVRDGGGEVRVAFNTCRVCNGAPRAFFVHQNRLFGAKGFVCQNCGNLFPAEKLGAPGGGCHPLAVPGLERNAETIRIPVDVLAAHRPYFRNWKRGL